MSYEDEQPNEQQGEPQPEPVGEQPPQAEPVSTAPDLEARIQEAVDAALKAREEAVTAADEEQRIRQAVEEALGKQDLPKVPRVDKIPETPEEVTALSGMLANFRKEVAALRQELRQRAGQTVSIAAPTETPEERRNKRLAAIADHSHYCPGCGELYKYARECMGPRGQGALGHPPIEVVSTEELGGDPDGYTKAPATDPTAFPVLA